MSEERDLFLVLLHTGFDRSDIIRSALMFSMLAAAMDQDTVLYCVQAGADVMVEGAGIAYRGLFLLDKDHVVRHQVVNDLPLGRNVSETLRMVDALQFTEQYGEVCPANWNQGDKSMKPNKEGLEEFFK